MKKLELNEMNSEQLQKVFGNNELFGEVSDDMAESEMDFISDQLEKLRPYLHNWSVGQCNRDQHIEVLLGYGDCFIREVDDISKRENMLSNDAQRQLKEAYSLLDEYENTDMTEEEEKCEELESTIDSTAQSLADIISTDYAETLDNYCLDSDIILEHFVDFYADERMDGDEYVLLDDNGGSDWELHKDVSYTKTWG